MTDLTNYLIAWGVYIITSILFFVWFWQLTRFKKRIAMSYYLRAVILVIIVTPWYVGGDNGLMAPALMIALMDAITAGGSAAVRAFVPLLLSLCLALVIVTIGLLLRRGVGRKGHGQTTE